MPSQTVVYRLLNLVNGAVSARVLHNRGRGRAAAAHVLAWAARTRFARLASGRWRPRSATANISVSLTSWTPRLRTLPLVLVGLLAQTQRPETILVWLTAEDIARVSSEVRGLFEVWGVQFRECEDFGPHKKWLPLLKTGMTKPFVICDDDVFYPDSWFAKLLMDDRSDAYVGTRCHRMHVHKDGKIAAYENWTKQVPWTGRVSHDLFITGVGGAIIHPHRISDEFREWKSISELCPKADDIWLKAAHTAAGIPCYKSRFTFPCLELPDSQCSSLLQSNVDLGGNDAQMAILQEYRLQCSK